MYTCQNATLLEITCHGCQHDRTEQSRTEGRQSHTEAWLQVVLHVKDFSLTVKAATLIFLSGRGSATPSANQGKSGSFDNLVKN